MQTHPRKPHFAPHDIKSCFGSLGEGIGNPRLGIAGLPKPVHYSLQLQKAYTVLNTTLLLQPLRCHCIECVIHHEQDDVREEQQSTPHICGANKHD